MRFHSQSLTSRPLSHSIPTVRVRLEGHLQASRALDAGTRLGFLFSFVRAELQVAAIAATEYVLSQINAEDEAAVDAAKKILHPLDGDRVGILDSLLPTIRSEQWPVCCKPWFEKGEGGTVIVVNCPNDGTPVELVAGPPAPQPGEIDHYDAMIRRIAQQYETRFARV